MRDCESNDFGALLEFDSVALMVRATVAVSYSHFESRDFWNLKKSGLTKGKGWSSCFSEPAAPVPGPAFEPFPRAFLSSVSER